MKSKACAAWMIAALLSVAAPMPAGAQSAPPLSKAQQSLRPDWVPAIAPKWRTMAALAASRGRDPRVFTVAGDSNSEYWWMMHPVARGEFGYATQPQLRAVAARYAPSFARDGLAARGGNRAAGMFVPDLADAVVCKPGEGVFECELRVSKASIVFIQLGTGDRFAWQAYEANMRRMIDYALKQGVVPVLATKADDLEEWQGGAPHDHMNTVVRRLAKEYGLPLIDFWAATRNLPVVPNPELPNRPFTKNGLLDEWGYYFHLSPEAKRLRTLSLLWTLEGFAR